MPATHHCRLPAAVNVEAADRAAAHHAGVSVDTIIKASSYRATERPSWTLKTASWPPPLRSGRRA